MNVEEYKLRFYSGLSGDNVGDFLKCRVMLLGNMEKVNSSIRSHVRAYQKINRDGVSVKRCRDLLSILLDNYDALSDMMLRAFLGLNEPVECGSQNSLVIRFALMPKFEATSDMEEIKSIAAQVLAMNRDFAQNLRVEKRAVIDDEGVREGLSAGCCNRFDLWD